MSARSASTSIRIRTVGLASPIAFERAVVLLAQGSFYIGCFLLYLVSRRTAHRPVGAFEEDAVPSYTLYRQEIESGRMANALSHRALTGSRPG